MVDPIIDPAAGVVRAPLDLEETARFAPRGEARVGADASSDRALELELELERVPEVEGR